MNLIEEPFALLEITEKLNVSNLHLINTMKKSSHIVATSTPY